MERWGFVFDYVLSNIKICLPIRSELHMLHLTTDIATDKYARTNLVTLLYWQPKKTPDHSRLKAWTPAKQSQAECWDERFRARNGQTLLKRPITGRSPQRWGLSCRASSKKQKQGVKTQWKGHRPHLRWLSIAAQGTASAGQENIRQDSLVRGTQCRWDMWGDLKYLFVMAERRTEQIKVIFAAIKNDQISEI